MRQSRMLARCLAASLFALVIAASCDGAIFVVRDPITGTSASVTTNPDGSFNVALSTTVINRPTTFTILGAAIDRINLVQVTATVPQFVFLDIRGASNGPIASLNRIDMGASTSTVLVKNLITSGDVGTLLVNTIIGMTVGGNLTGGITLLQRFGGGSSTLINATIQGRILGNVLVDHGDILGLTAAGGVGLPGSPVQVRTSGNLVKLLAADIYANITTISAGGTGATSEIRTTTGPFVGSLVTRAIETTEPLSLGVLSIATDLDADVIVQQNVANHNGGLPVVSIGGSLMSGRTFEIGGSLMPGAQISITGAQGLKGQVLINAADSGGAWSGLVGVGGAPLGPVPSYSASSLSLGTGSVGQVPFHLHAADTVPAPGAVLSLAAAPSPSNLIQLHYYGPVMWTPGATPLVIERRLVSPLGAWGDVTNCFLIGREMGPTVNPNVVVVFPLFALRGGFEYRVRPVLSGANRLQCDLGLAANPSVATPVGDYTFAVIGACPGDANADGAVNFADITAVVANWASVDPCNPTGDANADSLVNFADITSVVANWNITCAVAQIEGGADPQASMTRVANLLGLADVATLDAWIAQYAGDGRLDRAIARLGDALEPVMAQADDED